MGCLILTVYLSMASTRLATPLESLGQPERRLRRRVFAIWVLVVLGSSTAGLGTLVAAIVARRLDADAAGTIWASHVVSAVRTQWIGAIAGLCGAIATIHAPTVPWLTAVACWGAFRGAHGLRAAIARRPIDDPLGWL